MGVSVGGIGDGVGVRVGGWQMKLWIGDIRVLVNTGDADVVGGFEDIAE